MVTIPRGALCIASLVLAAGCDPIWQVNNPATASGTLDAACLDAGLRAWGNNVRTNHASNKSRYEFFVDAPDGQLRGVLVAWEPRRATTVDLALHGMGQRPQPDKLSRFRAARPELAAAIERSCHAQITLGAEVCTRCQ